MHMFKTNKGVDKLISEVITLILKQDNFKDISNYYLISLLNCNYKLIIKVLLNHLKILVVNLVILTQFIFLKSRKASENVITLNLTIDLLKKVDSLAVIIFLNFKKIYD
jgi:hypothetical protein